MVGFPAPKHRQRRVAVEKRVLLVHPDRCGPARLARNARAGLGRRTDVDRVDADDLREEALRGLLDPDPDRVAGHRRRRRARRWQRPLRRRSFRRTRSRGPRAVPVAPRGAPARRQVRRRRRAPLRVAVLAEPGADVDHRSCGCKKNRHEEDGERRSLAVFASHDHSKRSVVTLVSVPVGDDKPEDVDRIGIGDSAADVATGGVPVVRVAAGAHEVVVEVVAASSAAASAEAPMSPPRRLTARLCGHRRETHR